MNTQLQLNSILNRKELLQYLRNKQYFPAAKVENPFTTVNPPMPESKIPIGFSFHEFIHFCFSYKID